MKKSIFTLLIAPFYVTAANETLAEQTTNDIDTLEAITVQDTPFSQIIGTQKLTEEQISRLPSKNGNISELLRYNPNVQFSSMSDTSLSGGEIAPNEVSIHGEKFYNNNYTIDGLSNNDNTNPAENNAINAGKDVAGYSPTDLPSSGTQSLWLDKTLLKNVEVFDSNISAKYGNFTGGVINAELKDPNFEKFQGNISYRTTRDNWAEFYIQADQEEEFNQAENLGDQPQFTKNQYNITLNAPFNHKFAAIFHYHRQESKIPYHQRYLDEWNTQKRENETYYLRGVYLADNDDLWKATIIYSPHKSIYFKKDIKNGKFSNTGGGLISNILWEKNFSWGKMTSILGYKTSGNKVKHEEQNFTNYTYTKAQNNHQGFCSNINCKSAQIGGYGTFLTEKQSWQIKQDYEINAFNTFDIEHKLKLGWDIVIANAKYKREKDSYSYIYTNDVLKQYTLYPARNVSANDNIYSFYIEDNFKWKRLSTTLGLRFDRSQYLGNNNIAPRFSASYDVFGNGDTQIFGGLNRYYSGSILSYKLKNAIGTNTVCTVKNSKCTYKLGSKNYDVSNLKTPYSDEKVLGFSQTLLNTDIIFKWVQRHGKNQFVQAPYILENGIKTYHMNNQGESHSNTFTLEFNPKIKYDLKYAIINWHLGAQISKTNTNYSTYDQKETGYDYDKAIVNGKLKNIEDLPATDYNTPWSAFLNLGTEFPKLNLTWDQVFTYSAGYTGYTTSSGTCPSIRNSCGDFQGDVLIYDEYKQGSYFMLDWHFNYKLPIYQQQYLDISLDINNVLNRKIIANTANSTTYKMGRNFWLGVSYNW